MKLLHAKMRAGGLGGPFVPAALKVALALLLLSGVGSGRELLTSLEGRTLVFDALVDVFKEFYWNEDHLDWDAWAAAFREEALAGSSRHDFELVARKMVSAVADDHSSWLGLSSDGGDESMAATRTLGLGFQHDFLSGTGMVVLRVFPDTPAAAGGLRRGDVIARINERGLGDAVSSRSPAALLDSAIRAGKVELTVRRGAELHELSLEPAEIALAALSEMPQADMLDAGTGYLYLPSFNHSGVAARAHALLSDLKAQGATALVLDMRGNLGGRLSELGLFLGSFIEGPWAQALSRGAFAWRANYSVVEGKAQSWLETEDGLVFSRLALETAPEHWGGPLVVLADYRNSSAGELAPLILQAAGRAKVVGEATSGNVEAVRGFDLPDGSTVLVAVANLQSATGASFDDGLSPDVYATETLSELARGFDAPVAEAQRLLHELPFTPGKFF
ncbi:hypothetical protein BH24DEI1_BH24DEI1_11550 [soil metagenome]